MIDDPRGQHRVVGNALMGFSVAVVALGVGLTLAGFVGVGFIDGPTAIVLGGVMAGVGWWQRRLALAYDEA